MSGVRLIHGCNHTVRVTVVIQVTDQVLHPLRLVGGVGFVERTRCRVEAKMPAHFANPDRRDAVVEDVAPIGIPHPTEIQWPISWNGLSIVSKPLLIAHALTILMRGVRHLVGN